MRLNLYHAPGAGGTTVGRRLLWDLHTTFPVAILKHCDARQTAQRLTKLASLTESAVLVLVDGGQHSERDVDDLYDALRASQTPAVLLQVLRRFQKQKTGKRQFWLDSTLSDAEADRFRDVLTKAMPSRAVQISRLAQRRSDPQRNAFFFGLTAYGRDFRGLESYVTSHLEGLSEVQSRMLTYAAMAHYYGQQSIPVQAFASVLGIPRSRTVNLNSAFAGSATPALDLLVEYPRGEWRTVHQLVAQEILQQQLSPRTSTEKAQVWRQNLSEWAKSFGAFCRGDESSPSERLLELARRVFIYRDNTELLGTERSGTRQFAQLIEDIPSIHGRVEVLRHLTEQFPLEAHFHAHLGRILGLSGQFDEALSNLEYALSIQPDDHVLHHMRGMVLRYAIKELGRSHAPIANILERAKLAAASFETARVIAPDLQHAYISEIQLLIDVVDLAGKSRRDPLKNVLPHQDTDPFLRDALERAEDLLDRVQSLYANEEPSRYVVDSRAQLQRLYGDFATALQAWDNLLARPGIAKPPVRRQIVWTMLRRRGGDWANLDRKELERTAGLLEENLQEETSDSTSLRLWLRAIRHSQSPPSLDSVIERVGYWKSNTSALDASYYLYVLHAIRALEGSNQALMDIERCLEECRALAKYRRDRNRSFEWVGALEGVRKLVHQSRLGEWKGDFWEATDALAVVCGRISSIDGPQKGTIELDGGLTAFFVPGKGDFHSGRDENATVKCYVGFSYDGARAWDVHR